MVSDFERSFLLSRVDRLHVLRQEKKNKRFVFVVREPVVLKPLSVVELNKELYRVYLEQNFPDLFLCGVDDL